MALAREFVSAANDASVAVREALIQPSTADSPSPSSSGVPVPREKIEAAAANLRHAATKVAAVWKDVDTLEISGVTGTLEPLVSASIALHSYCDAHYLLPGSTLKQVVKGYLKDVGEACAALLDGAASLSKKQRQKDRLAQLVGVVWEKCDLIPKLPRDNRAAIGRALAKLATTMKDIVREMDEIHLHEGAEEGGAPADEEDEDGFDDEDDEDDDLDFDAKFDEEDMLLVDAARPIFPAVIDVMKGMVRELAEGVEPSEKDQLALLESALASAKRVQVAAEGLGASMYPPQDAAEVSKYRTDLEQATIGAVEALCKRRELEGRPSGALDIAVAALLDTCKALGEATQ